MRALDRLLHGVNAALEAVCHVLLATIVAVTSMQVFLRYALDAPTSWSEELALLLLIWFGMIAIAIAVRRHGHIAITVLHDRLPPGAARAVSYLAELLVLVFAVMLVVRGFDLIRLAGVQTMPATGLGRAWLYYPVVFGGVLMVANGLGNILFGRTEAAAPETLP